MGQKWHEDYSDDEERKSTWQTRVIDCVGVTALIALAVLLWFAFRGG